MSHVRETGRGSSGSARTFRLFLPGFRLPFEIDLPRLPDGVLVLGLFVLAIGLAFLLHRLLFRLVSDAVGTRDLFVRSLVARVRGPSRLAMILFASALAASSAPLSGAQAATVRHGLLIVLIALIGWVARVALHVWTTVYLRRFKLDAEDNLLARKHVTQTRILQRIADFVILVLAAAGTLMTFEGVQQYGVSLLASAGAAGIVVGLALQPVLKNVFAGVQLAVTQPIRIDDALLVEGEWGNVEEITTTYVVLRLWDWRRMILPLSYFIENPFQNWTRESASLIGAVAIQLDYRTPVDLLRAEAQRIAAASPLWDRNVVNVQVTDFRERTMEVRILISAATSGRAFDLRCEMREKLVAFLQREHPVALPVTRNELRFDALADRTGRDPQPAGTA